VAGRCASAYTAAAREEAVQTIRMPAKIYASPSASAVYSPASHPQAYSENHAEEGAMSTRPHCSRSTAHGSAVHRNSRGSRADR